MSDLRVHLMCLYLQKTWVQSRYRYNIYLDSPTSFLYRRLNPPRQKYTRNEKCTRGRQVICQITRSARRTLHNISTRLACRGVAIYFAANVVQVHGYGVLSGSGDCCSRNRSVCTSCRIDRLVDINERSGSTAAAQTTPELL